MLGSELSGPRVTKSKPQQNGCHAGISQDFCKSLQNNAWLFNQNAEGRRRSTKEKPPSRPRTADFGQEAGRVDVGGAFDWRPIMAMSDFAVLAA